MKEFHNGVSYYTKAKVEVGFPESDIVCAWCPMLMRDYGLDRQRCGLTGEILLAPKFSIGDRCPLEFEVKE